MVCARTNLLSTCVLLGGQLCHECGVCGVCGVCVNDMKVRTDAHCIERANERWDGMGYIEYLIVPEIGDERMFSHPNLSERIRTNTNGF